MGFSAIGKGKHNHKVLLDTPLHVDTVTDESKLPWHWSWRVNSPKITNFWTLPSRCLQLRTTRNMGQDLWQNYVLC